MIAQGFAVIGYGLLGIGGSLAMIYVARAIEGIGGGILGVTQSYVADLTEPKDRGKAFGLVGAMFGAGFVFGPALGGLLVHFGYAVPFFVAAGMQIVTMLLTVFMLPESYTPGDKPPTLADIGASLADPKLRNLLLQQLLFSFSFTLWVTVFALFVERVLKFGPEQTATLYVVPGVIGVVVQLFVLGKLTDRFGERPVALGGLAFGVVAMAVIYFVRDLPLFFVSLALWSCAGALVRPTLGSMISQAAPADQRGTILGVNDSLNSFAFIVGPLISTAVLSYNVHYVGILPVICGLTAILVGLAAPKLDNPSVPLSSPA